MRTLAASGAAVAAVITLAMAVSAGIATARRAPAGGVISEIAEGSGQRPAEPLGR